MLADKYGLKVRVVPYGGGQKILPSLDAKRFEMALLGASDVYFAYNGLEEFKDKPSKNIRAGGVTFAYYLTWFVRKDAPYKTIADLKGKKVAVGFSSNTSQRRSVLAQMASAGLTEADFNGVQVPHVVRGADDLAQGKVEATSFAVGAGKVAEVNAKIGGVRYISIPTGDDAKARVRKLMPMAGFKVLMPESKLLGIVEPTNVLTDDYQVVLGAHVTDEVAYKLTKMLHDDQAELAKIARPFRLYDKSAIARERGAPYHPGSIKFLKEKGLWPPRKD